MSQSYTGEIRMFAGGFAPCGWAFCDGQEIAISQNAALYSLINTIYGGDGRTVFRLPDLRGRIPIHRGQGARLSDRRLGSQSGSENVTITTAQMPEHHHRYYVSKDSREEGVGPFGTYMSGNSNLAEIFPRGLPNPVEMNSHTMTKTGNSRPHSNLMPSLCVNFMISLEGYYPSRP